MIATGPLGAARRGVLLAAGGRLRRGARRERVHIPQGDLHRRRGGPAVGEDERARCRILCQLPETGGHQPRQGQAVGSSEGHQQVGDGRSTAS